MRPVRIELEGFSAYRQAVAVDFGGVDFFSLSGPTGSGKSSLVDAMIFALFGRVPRLGGNAVAPAITAGADRARVRFDFDIDDTTYTAVRLAQRTSTGGATVKEARLQQGDKVLADGADDVTAAVEELLKLRFDDFTRAVVLPQGDFARFLTATKSERQGLLRNLLGMDVYTRVRDLAKTREAVAVERADGATRVLQSLDLADQDEIATAEQRRETLSALSESMPQREKTLADLEAEVERVSNETLDLSRAIERLGAIVAPDRLAELDMLIAEARANLTNAEEAREAAIETLRTAESSVESLPSLERVSSWKKGHEKLEAIEQELADPEADEVTKRVAEATGALIAAESELEKAREKLTAARSQHSAHVLAGDLTVGAPCPVCTQTVLDIPEPVAAPGLDRLTAEEAQARAAVESARQESEKARSDATRIEAGRAGLEQQKVELLAELAGTPGPDELIELEKDLLEAHRAIEEARTGLANNEHGEKAARATLEDLAGDSMRVAKLLREAERTVSDLEPPLSDSSDVVVQWKELIGWRDEKVEQLRERLVSVEESVSEAAEKAREARACLVDTLGEHGVPADEPYAVQVATELHSVRAYLDAQAKAARDAADLRELADAATSDAAVAGSLANHLRANGFEQWLMAGALTDLVSGANELLGQLSGDGYSLHSDDSGSFSIVDHRNADEMRSVATLSGGETFLVSLALALALAETLSAKGGSGLDAIILDEGFGTLDDESLDTVASVLEELTGRGLMVGVITHVKELATRAPVRYEVRREAGGAAVRLAS